MRYHLGWQDRDGRRRPPRQARPPSALRRACEAVGGDVETALPLAAALELLHNFSLIHDDIEDASPQRHGRDTVWRVWGVPLAVNAGDGMFALAHVALRPPAPRRRRRRPALLGRHPPPRRRLASSLRRAVPRPRLRAAPRRLPRRLPDDGRRQDGRPHRRGGRQAAPSSAKRRPPWSAPSSSSARSSASPSRSATTSSASGAKAATPASPPATTSAPARSPSPSSTRMENAPPSDRADLRAIYAKDDADRRRRCPCRRRSWNAPAPASRSQETASRYAAEALASSTARPRPGAPPRPRAPGRLLRQPRDLTCAKLIRFRALRRSSVRRAPILHSRASTLRLRAGQRHPTRSGLQRALDGGNR